MTTNEALDYVVAKLKEEKTPSGSLRSVKKIFKGITDNVGAFPIIALIPLRERFQGVESADSQGHSKIETVREFSIDIYSHNIKPKSAYNQAMGIMETVKNLLHYQQDQDIWNIGGDAIGLEIVRENMDNGKPYKNGFLQKGSIEFRIISKDAIFYKDTYEHTAWDSPNSMTYTQPKEVLSDMVTLLKAAKPSDLTGVKIIKEGSLGNESKFPCLFVTADAEGEDHKGNYNLAARTYSIDLITKRAKKLDSLVQNMELVEKVKAVLWKNAHFNGKLQNMEVVHVDYGQVAAGNIFLFATTIEILGETFQSVL